jgi:hypothetical protein
MHLSNEIVFAWILYGGLFGTFCGAISIYVIGKKIGYSNVNWKHYFIVMSIFIFPTLILPILFVSFFSLLEKIVYSIMLIIFFCIKYFVITKAQENIARLR